MKDFLYRTITEEMEVTDEDGNAVKACAWRTRHSNGHRMIGIEFGKQRIEFTIGDDYEQHARLVMDLLDKVCSDPCELPKAPNVEVQRRCAASSRSVLWNDGFGVLGGKLDDLECFTPLLRVPQVVLHLLAKPTLGAGVKGDG